MTDPNLGRLTRVDLKEVWDTESGSFTPWLSKEVNISLLGEAIGVELEVVAKEKNVGPFRADIFCRETTTGDHVLIENQLERTDHTHLGQLLTYSAGLTAVRIVWIARRFTDEHRAALDWLNQFTQEGIDFFGLEIEVWKIGESVPAPKFNVVSQPNDWKKSVRDRSGPGARSLSEMEQDYLDFWTQLSEFLESNKSSVSIGKPSSDSWRLFPLGRTDFSLRASNGMRDGWSAVSLIMAGELGTTRFQSIRDQFQEEIETKLGSVEWEELPKSKESRITLQSGIDPADRKAWG